MITVKLTVSYDGTDFSGWQRQKNGESVQGVLEAAVEKITGENITVTGSGRTDAGVHAEGQVASFSTLSTVPPEKFAAALNTVLPPSVKVLKSEKARDGLNARKDAKRKTYRYSVHLSDVEQPLNERYKKTRQCLLAKSLTLHFPPSSPLGYADGETFVSRFNLSLSAKDD